MRRVNFQNNEFYHIYNRGNDKREIFLDKYDYVRFIVSLREFNQITPVGSLHVLRNSGPTANALAVGPLVRVICYCLIRNHYHFILQQLTENGVSEFMKRLNGGYTGYFNSRYTKSGSLFQGKYKYKHIQADEYLQYLSAYINANAQIHKLAKAENYKWCSYPDYLEKRNGNLCDKKIILEEFDNLDDYREYVNIIINNAGERKDALKEYLLE